MTSTSLPPGPPVDIRDPRIRVTFADVAMRLVLDGPMYGAILLIGVLAMRGTLAPSESITGVALSLLARSRPPEIGDKLGRAGQAVMPFLIVGLLHLLWTMGDLPPSLARPRSPAQHATMGMVK